MNIHSIIIADTGDALQIGVVLEERTTRTKSTEVTSYLCAFYPGPDEEKPLQAFVAQKDLAAIDAGYAYGVHAFLQGTPAATWAERYVAELNPPPAPAPATTPAQDAATPAV